MKVIKKAFLRKTFRRKFSTARFTILMPIRNFFVQI